MIKIENVSKQIKGRSVLKEINLVFDTGYVYGLKGINGSGKTMLMRMIAGLIYPDTGSVYLNEKKLGTEISFPGNMGILLENPVFLDRYTGKANLELLASLDKKTTKEDVIESLNRVGLDPEDKRKYRKFSLGMKQRLGIAAAIMGHPEVILLDEPLNALDTQGVELFDRILQEERQGGSLIILTCHDAQKLQEYADYIVTIENGSIMSVVGQNT